MFSSLKPKLDIGLFVDFAEFPWIPQFLHDVIIKLFCRSKQNNFMIISCKNGYKTGKFSKINKQSDVKFWLNWIEFGAVSYVLSCKEVSFSRENFSGTGCILDTIQDFLCKLDMKPHMHLVEISIFSLNHVVTRPIKIIKDLCKAST